MSLTPRMHQLLTFIVQRQRDSGVTPTFDEACGALGVKGKSGICRLVAMLQERGYVRHRTGVSRSIEVLRLPDDMPAHWLRAVSTAALLRELKRRGDEAEATARTSAREHDHA